MIIFLNEGSDEKGENAFSFVLILERSAASLSILAGVASLCCSLVVYVKSLKSCMAMLISDVMGADIVHNADIVPLSSYCHESSHRRFSGIS